MKLFVLALLAGLAQPDSRVGTVRVHGNHSIPDAEVTRIAGVEVGDAFTDELAALVEARLVGSGRFESVDVRVRYRGLSSSGDVAMVLLVREKRSAASRFMVAPLFDATDEYGVTLGARVAVVDLGGEDRALGFPISFGGTRQAAVEGRVGAFRFDLARRRRVNPHFDAPDNRLELGGSYRSSFKRLSAELRGRWSDVDFLGLDERVARFGGRVSFDTRVDPTIPGDAFFAGLGVERLAFESDEPRDDVQLYRVDLRGYKRLVGQALLAVQVDWTTASGRLPPYEQRFLGGGGTLRGTAPGRFIGDNRALATAELRLPMTSPLSFARAGFHVFYDTGAVYDHGVGIRKARFHHGVGVGTFFRFAMIGLRTDVGWDLEGTTRFHIASQFKF